MKRSHRIAATAIMEARRFAALATARAGRGAQSIRKQRPSFRPLSPAETEALLGAELLAALADARRHAYVLSRIGVA